jgi:hypothetical protein
VARIHQHPKTFFATKDTKCTKEKHEGAEIQKRPLLVNFVFFVAKLVREVPRRRATHKKRGLIAGPSAPGYPSNDALVSST